MQVGQHFFWRVKNQVQQKLHEFARQFLGVEQPLGEGLVALDSFACRKGALLELFGENENALKHDLIAFIEHELSLGNSVAGINLDFQLDRPTSLNLNAAYAEDAASMCTALLKSKAIDLVVLYAWTALPLKTEAQVSLSVNVNSYRRRFFEQATVALAKNVREKSGCVLLVNPTSIRSGVGEIFSLYCNAQKQVSQ
jgi:hypothetical protein